MSTNWNTNCCAMSGKYKYDKGEFLIVFYGTKWNLPLSPLYLMLGLIIQKQQLAMKYLLPSIFTNTNH